MLNPELDSDLGPQLKFPSELWLLVGLKKIQSFQGILETGKGHSTGLDKM